MLVLTCSLLVCFIIQVKQCPCSLSIYFTLRNSIAYLPFPEIPEGQCPLAIILACGQSIMVFMSTLSLPVKCQYLVFAILESSSLTLELSSIAVSLTTNSGLERTALLSFHDDAGAPPHPLLTIPHHFNEESNHLPSQRSVSYGSLVLHIKSILTCSVLWAFVLSLILC